MANLTLIRCDLGNEVTVMLCTSDLIRDAFKQDAFSGRAFSNIETLNAIQPIGHKGTRI